MSRLRSKPAPTPTPLAHWFGELDAAAATHGGVLLRSAETARGLLIEPREVTTLHGDLHHDNVLDFGPRSWLAIDPKHVSGERTVDLANIFTNPDLAGPTRPARSRPNRAVSSAAWRWSRRPPWWSARACCAGSWQGPDCRRHDSSATTTQWPGSTWTSRAWR